MFQFGNPLVEVGALLADGVDADGVGYQHTEENLLIARIQVEQSLRWCCLWMVVDVLHILESSLASDTDQTL